MSSLQPKQSVWLLFVSKRSVAEAIHRNCPYKNYTVYEESCAGTKGFLLALVMNNESVAYLSVNKNYVALVSSQSMKIF